MFIPAFGKTFAELPVEVKNANSHRGKAARQMVDLIRQKRDMLLLNEVETGLRLVRYAPGRIEFELRQREQQREQQDESGQAEQPDLAPQHQVKGPHAIPLADAAE